MNLVFLGNLDQNLFANKTILIRTDYNVGLVIDNNNEFQVLNDARIRSSLDTIRFLLESRAKIILCSHLGRPTGPEDKHFSLKPVAKRFQELIGNVPFQFVEDCIGEQVQQAKANLSEGQILLLENLRFHKGEEENDPEFAKQLCNGIDLYVNEAFAASHRGKYFILTDYISQPIGILLYVNSSCINCRYLSICF
jgi:phosphoglycerate kinase